MLRTIKIGGLLLLNVVITVIETAVLDTARVKDYPAMLNGGRRVEGVHFTHCSCRSARIWVNSIANWTWILPAAWFAFGLFATAHSDVIGKLLPFWGRRKAWRIGDPKFFCLYRRH